MSEALTRIAEAEAAKLAWDRFVAPALATLRADYMAKLTDEAVKPMEGRALTAVQNLSIALRVTREVENQIHSIMMDGKAAQAELTRAGDIARLEPEARRYARY
ncbi:hypothetical protein [Sphingomonas sp. NIC1]|uniref:hypothetical protein n=1 Tax=unclassified Sphingomonas TaxID=196159 RepID=UPI0007C10252|nr:hypothetical protein [Sphingomonas sp. NIC1]ANC85455.1 hypothetical protein A7E77_00210 [Sphingomonas sp. NIC1]